MNDQLWRCDICTKYRHVSQRQVNRKACLWCQRAWEARRDHGIRHGLYSAEEIANQLAAGGPTEPWKDGEMYEEPRTPAPSIEQLNAPSLWLPGQPEAEMPVAPTFGATKGTIFSHKGRPAGT